MTTGSGQRVFRLARITAMCRAHPGLALVAAVLALATAAATGYIARANTAQPATEAAPIPGVEAGIAPGTAPGETKARDTVVWRDEAGAVYRAKVAGGRFDEFLRQRKGPIETARTESRDQAAAEIAAALKPVFAVMRARVPKYADWYFGYTTKYELMAHALLPAIDYLGRRLDLVSDQEPRRRESLVQLMGAHMVAYLEEQYAERVVRPRQAEIRLQAAFDKSYGVLHARWARIVAEQRAALRAFIKEATGSAERLPADQTADLKLDWDASRDGGSAMHKEGMIDQSFRRGLLSLRLTIAKSATTPAPPDISENTAKETDEITHVIVNLFDKVAGPVVSQMGDLAIGIVAGSAASGTTVGFGMAGTPMVVASGVASAVPIGAAIGLATTVVAEVLSNRLEESLSRVEFEENIRQTVDATENAVETKMISVLDAHVEAWYADIADPIAVK
jgi:hypothetical protein